MEAPPSPFPPHIEELPGLRVTVDNVVYEPRLDAPPERPHPFLYFLTIHNDSTETVCLVGRKWVVTNGQDGSRLVVEGEGIVGERPRLEPGQSFSYHSYHPVAGDSRAEGAFFGTCEHDGRAVCVRVPAFALRVPR